MGHEHLREPSHRYTMVGMGIPALLLTGTEKAELNLTKFIRFQRIARHIIINAIGLV